MNIKSSLVNFGELFFLGYNNGGLLISKTVFPDLNPNKSPQYYYLKKKAVN
jgi:hypothetical protein